MISRAKLKADSLISEFEIDEVSILVEHLEDFCFELGAAVQYKPLTGYEAKITARNGKGIITVNSDEKRIERVRFSIGHELGHFLLHCNEVEEFSCSKNDMSEWFSKQKAISMEAEANEFSIELLMAEKLAKPVVNAQKPSIESIESVASMFKMSLSATAMRYVDLSDEPVAVVFYSKEKGVRNFKCSSYFERQEYRFRFGPLDGESLAYDVVNGKDHLRMSSVAGTAWLDLPNWLDEALIQEQTRYFPQFDMGFSLLWMKSGSIIRY